MKAAAYWALATLLLLFGLVGIFSVGAPFLLLGLVLLIVGPWRHQPRLFWPVIAGVLGSILGFALVTPLSCTTSARSVSVGERGSMQMTSDSGHTSCTNALGIDYSGSGSYSPSSTPALLAGLATAATGAALARLLVQRGPATRSLRRHPPDARP